MWVPIWFVTTTVSQALAELLEHLGHSQLMHMVAHLVPEALLLPLVALPSVIMTFELVDLERAGAPLTSDPTPRPDTGLTSGLTSGRLTTIPP